MSSKKENDKVFSDDELKIIKEYHELNRIKSILLNKRFGLNVEIEQLKGKISRMELENKEIFERL